MYTIYWQYLKQIAHDIWRLFQNFWHWNLSKVTIFIVTLLTAVVLSIPFLGIIWFLINNMVGGLGVSVIQDLMTTGILPDTVVDELLKNYWIIGIILVCGVIIFGIITCMMTYGYYLNIRVYQSYIEGGRLDIRKNDYLSVRHIWKYLGILGWSSLYLAIPVLFGMVGAGILMYLTTGSGLLVSQPIIGGILFVATLIFLFFFIKIAVQVMFSYILMLEKDALTTPARELVQKSIALAKGNVLQIIALLLPFAVLVALGGVLLQNIKEYRDIRVLENAANTAVLSNPTTYINDHAFIQREYLDEERLDESQKRSTIAINNAFNPRTDGIDKEYLRAIYPFIMLSGTMESSEDIMWQIAISLLSFFLLEGIMLMVYLSIYHILTESERKEIVDIKKQPTTFHNLSTHLKAEKVYEDTEKLMPTITTMEAKKPVAKKKAPEKTPTKTPSNKKADTKKSTTKKPRVTK
ncbi:MAG: hypothetical protein PHU93_01930 [Candidatus Gracilibacteria bacterium]|nr:hypothetical protein [Candidatus Gracilibacteria bacterium]